MRWRSPVGPQGARSDSRIQVVPWDGGYVGPERGWWCDWWWLLPRAGEDSLGARIHCCPIEEGLIDNVLFVGGLWVCGHLRETSGCRWGPLWLVQVMLRLFYGRRWCWTCSLLPDCSCRSASEGGRCLADGGVADIRFIYEIMLFIIFYWPTSCDTPPPPMVISCVWGHVLWLIIYLMWRCKSIRMGISDARRTTIHHANSGFFKFC